MTLRIHSTHKPSQGDFVIIEDADFDPTIHTLYEEDKPAPQPKPEKKTPRK